MKSAFRKSLLYQIWAPNHCQHTASFRIWLFIFRRQRIRWFLKRVPVCVVRTHTKCVPTCGFFFDLNFVGWPHPKLPNVPLTKGEKNDKPTKLFNCTIDPCSLSRSLYPLLFSTHNFLCHKFNTVINLKTITTFCRDENLKKKNFFLFLPSCRRRTLCVHFFRKWIR